jgi:hypothetical protein
LSRTLQYRGDQDETGAEEDALFPTQSIRHQLSEGEGNNATDPEARVYKASDLGGWMKVYSAVSQVRARPAWRSTYIL